VDINDMEVSMPDNFTSSLERISHTVNEQFAGRRDAPATGQDLYNVSVMIDGNFMKLEVQIAALHARFDQVDARFAQIDGRFDGFMREVESMFNRKMLNFLYMQIGISLALFSAMFTALYFSLGALVGTR
jgi:hypothetical protein